MVSFIFLLFIFALLIPLLHSAINQPIWGQNRIVGGQGAKISDFPFMLYLEAAGGETVCGGAIISEKWGLSAAHCFQDVGKAYELDKYIVMSGDAYVGKTDPISNTRTTHKIKQYYMHENYGIANYGYDISVFEVIEPFVFGPNVSYIGLPSTDKDINAPSARIAGWGCVKYDTEAIDYLKYTWLVKFTEDECSNQWYVDVEHKESVFCYAAGKDTKGNPGNSCPGDSGGPLFTENNTVIGVSSMIYTDITDPALFTNVLYYRDWIKEKTNI